MIVSKNTALFCLVDVQEKLFIHMQNKKQLQSNLVKLLKGLELCAVDTVVLEQYKKGIGPTVSALHPYLKNARFFDKTSFSACKNEEFTRALQKSGKSQIIVAGTEAHVCVAQTCLDLLNRGYEVYLVTDCTSSRKINDKEIALARLSAEGVKLLTYESVLFELIGDANNPLFKAMLAIVK
ncbi:MAG: hydrolase [Campylobacterota bacterium]